MAPRLKKEQTCQKASAEKDEEYLQKRARNNKSVQKSREKSKQKDKETLERADYLKKENKELEGKVKELQKEQAILKEMLLSSAGQRKRSRASRDVVATENAPNMMISMDSTGQQRVQNAPYPNYYNAHHLWS